MRRQREQEALMARVQELMDWLLAERLVALQLALDGVVRERLWEMAVPLAEALQRLDHRQELTRSRLQVMQAQQVEMRNQQEQLLLEILQATQPSALTQLSPLIGLPTQQTLSPISGS